MRKRPKMERELCFISPEPHNRIENGIWSCQTVLALHPTLHMHTLLHSELHCAVCFRGSFPLSWIFPPYWASCKSLRSVLPQSNYHCFRINEWRAAFSKQLNVMSMRGTNCLHCYSGFMKSSDISSVEFLQCCFCHEQRCVTHTLHQLSWQRSFIWGLTGGLMASSKV